MNISDAEPQGDRLTLRGQIEDSRIPELLRPWRAAERPESSPSAPGTSPRACTSTWGRVVYARSSNPDERMGEILLPRGRITVRQCLDAGQMIHPRLALPSFDGLATLADVRLPETASLSPVHSETRKEFKPALRGWRSRIGESSGLERTFSRGPSAWRPS